MSVLSLMMRRSLDTGDLLKDSPNRILRIFRVTGGPTPHLVDTGPATVNVDDDTHRF